jgi:uncharacterized protein YjbI with pentapeptide repeats
MCSLLRASLKKGNIIKGLANAIFYPDSTARYNDFETYMTDIQIPNDDLSADDIHPGADLAEADLSNAELRGANLQNADLVYANLSGANLPDADLSEARLGGADLTKAYLAGANLEDAFLDGSDVSGANFSLANLNNAIFDNTEGVGAHFASGQLCDAVLYNSKFTGAGFSDCDLNGSDLRHSDFSTGTFQNADLTDAMLGDANLDDVDLREADIAEAHASGSTTVSLSDEIDKDSASGWDEAARVCHDLKLMFNNSGLMNRARRFHFLERRAREREAKARGGVSGWADYFGSIASRYLTGYGVQISRIATVMLILFSICTSWYYYAGIENSIYYSVVTFTTSPPSSPPEGFVTQFLAMLETFFGTLLIVLLGYVLGNREQF